MLIGTSGAGKTVMAKRIASTFDLACIELDRLHWEPNWEALSLWRHANAQGGATNLAAALGTCARDVQGALMRPLDRNQRGTIRINRCGASQMVTHGKRAISDFPGWPANSR
jgi:hypothetical protein